MSDDLYRLIYLSRNEIDADTQALDEQIDSILETSRQNNARDHITGALMFNTGCFAQVLEGGHDAIQAAFERIQGDARHSRITILAFEHAQRRGFCHWAMAYVGENADSRERFATLLADSDFDLTALAADDIDALLRAHLIEAETG